MDNYLTQLLKNKILIFETGDYLTQDEIEFICRCQNARR